MKRAKYFTHWSFIFLPMTITWLVISQNQNRLSFEGTEVVSYPLVASVVLMMNYERKIRALRDVESSKK
jgi:hypothetical protein